MLNDDPLASAAGGADDIAGIGDVDAQAALPSPATVSRSRSSARRRCSVPMKLL